MMSGISTVLNGFNAAVTRLEVSANNIASPQSTVPDVDLAQQLVNTKIGSYDAQANLKVLKVQNDLQRQALNILS
jgi:flagellar basal body rod protein FlgC